MRAIETGVLATTRGPTARSVSAAENPNTFPVVNRSSAASLIRFGSNHRFTSPLITTKMSTVGSANASTMRSPAV